MANLAEAEGKQKDAIFYLQEALSTDETNSELILRLATLLRDEEPWRARRLLMSVVARDPKDAVAYLGLSQVELSMGQHQQALNSVKRSISLDDSIPGSYWQLGILYESLIDQATKTSFTFDGDLRASAVRAFDDFVAHGGQPEWKARLEQARVLATGKRNRTEAMAAARRALEIARQAEGDFPKLQAARHLSSVARATRDRKAYADATEAVLEVTPRDFHAWKNLAELRAASGGSAEKVYQDLLALYPGDADAHSLYARHIGLTKGYLNAVRYYEQIVEESAEPARILSYLVSYQVAYRMAPHANRTLARMETEFPDDPWTQLEQAKKQATDGYSKAAIEALKAVVAEYEISEAYEALARLTSFYRGSIRAADYARRAVDLKGFYEIKLHRLLAETLFDARKFADHLETIEVIERYEDLTHEQLISKASSLYETDEAGKSRQILLTAVNDPEAQIAATLMFVAHEAGNRKQGHLARKLVIAALEHHPDNQDLLLAHADVNMRMGRPDLALDVLNQFDIIKFPAHIRFARAKLRAEEGDLSGAFPDLSHALRADPSVPGLLDFAVLMYSRKGVAGKQDSRISEWIEGIRADTTNQWLSNSRKIAHLQLLRSRILHTNNKNESAIQILEQAISDFEFTADTRIDLAYLLAITEQDVNRAIAIAEDVVDPENPDPRALDALGFAYLSAEQPMAALQNFRLANRAADNRVALFLYHQSMVLAQLGREAEALRAIDQALAVDPTYSNAVKLRQSLVTKNDKEAKPS